MRKIGHSAKSVLFLLLFAVPFCFSLVMTSCSDDINDDDLYVFKGEQVADLVMSNSNLSKYYTLLTRARSGKKGSTMDHMLRMRGNYTCFAPTNEAVQNFVDSIYDKKNYDISQISDSLAEEIVFNSIIDNGNTKSFESVDFHEGVLPLKTMADRYMIIGFVANDTGRVAFTVNTFSKIIVSDNEASNGQVHIVDRVVMPTTSTLPSLLSSTANTRIFAKLLEITGWADSMQRYRDEEYEAKEHPQGFTNSWYAGCILYEPEHHNWGCTAFVESDSLLEARWGVNLKIKNGMVQNWDEVLPRIKEVCKGYYPYAKSEDLTSKDNAVNQFISYHITDQAKPYNQLVVVFAQLGYSYNDPNRVGIDKFQYYESMGKDNRIIKLTFGQQTDGYRINRYVSKYDPNSYDELEVPRPGIRILPNNGKYETQALNGFYHMIDDILVYDNDVPNKVLNERMRWDTQSMQPEIQTNGLRFLPENKRFSIPQGYLRKVRFDQKSTLYVSLCTYNVGYMNYEADDTILEGFFDVTWQLPPVPFESTYELRLGYCNDSGRGMVQFYFGENPDNLTAVGLPVDARRFPGNSVIGWKKDVNDPQINRANDKAMRNHGYMKCPNCFGSNSDHVLEGGRNVGPAGAKLRRIVTTAKCKPGKKYYLRIKAILNRHCNFGPDFMEWVPKSVYNGPVPEDKW